jgi:hypothetical protein
MRSEQQIAHAMAVAFEGGHRRERHHVRELGPKPCLERGGGPRPELPELPEPGPTCAPLCNSVIPRTRPYVRAALQLGHPPNAIPAHHGVRRYLLFRRNVHCLPGCLFVPSLQFPP